MSFYSFCLHPCEKDGSLCIVGIPYNGNSKHNVPELRPDLPLNKIGLLKNPLNHDYSQLNHNTFNTRLYRVKANMKYQTKSQYNIFKLQYTGAAGPN